LSALQSLQDPVLSPSTSSFSLDEMWYQLFQFRLWCWLGFQEKLPSRQRADGRMIRAEKDFRCAWILIECEIECEALCID
jgi:hypothetical protein